MNKDNKVIIKRINDWLECYQNKDNGFYNATALLKQYNEHYPEKPKKMIEFLRLENTQKYIGCVLSDGKAQRGNSPLGCKNTKKTKPNIFGMVENQDNSFPNIFGKIDNEKDTLFYVKKGRKSKNTQVSDYQVCDNSHTPDNQQVTEITDTLLYMKKGRTLKNGTQIPNTYYFAPMLFSKFGTWLSPELERDIHKVLWNNVLEYRNELRRINPKLHDSIATIAGDDNNIYIKVHSMLNKAVFGRFEREGKQIDSGSENQLNMMKDIESEIIVLIKHNLITDYEQLKTHIQRYYL